MTRPARIPADVNRPDRVLGPFTARQSALLITAAAALYGAWLVLRDWVPLPIFLAAAVPVAALAAAVALGHRDGLPLDRFLLAALRHHANPHRLNRTLAADYDADADAAEDDGGGYRSGRPHALPRPGPARLLTHAATTPLGPDPRGAGVLDLGGEGLVAIAVVSTLNLALHTPAEQDALLSGYARYLHTLTGPVQFLIRTVPLDLTGHLAALYQQAATLPHPALLTAALGHRAHLARLATPTAPGGDEDGGDGLTARQVLLVVREPASSSGGQRLARRLQDAIHVLATLDIPVTPLDAAQIRALLSDCTNPDQLDQPDHPHSDHPAIAHPRTGHPRTGQLHGGGPAPVAPIAIARRHPQVELDDEQLEELSLTDERPPNRATPRPHRAADPWAQLPPVATHGAPVDFALADDGDDDGQGDDGQGDSGWFDDAVPRPDTGYDHPTRGDGGGGDPSGAFDSDRFDGDELDATSSIPPPARPGGGDNEPAARLAARRMQATANRQPTRVARGRCSRRPGSRSGPATSAPGTDGSPAHWW